MKNLKLFVSFLLLLAFKTNSYSANDSTYEQRRNAYIDSALINFGHHAIPLQAYRNVPVDSATLSSILNGLPTNGTADFDIVQLVRVLYLSNGQYDTAVMSVLNTLPFWLTNHEVLRDYWSENHMCQWMTSDFLLHERYSRPIDSRLHYRMLHYLQLKVQYGFYEFLSTDYGPYCLSGLLNLADFAQDPEIKSLATQASQKLLTDLLMATNSLGTCYPTAGRNYYGKYETPYDQNYNSLIWLLTGFGQQQTSASHSGGFLASSSIPVDGIIQSWKPHLDTTLIIGHTLEAGFTINDTLNPTDKILFQWSSGAYFAPEVSQATAQLLTDSNMWTHPDFSTFSVFQSTPPSQFSALSTSLNYASESSIICNDTVKIFKDNTVVLSSVQNFWPGKWGFEEIPCVANVGTTAVFTASGKVIANFENRAATNENNDLPAVTQRSNVALVMYRPDIKLRNLGIKDPEVSLHWIDSVFDEVRNDSTWLLGRQGNGYVGVRRGCIQVINTLRACSEPNGQTWVIMVGDSSMYGSFNNFQAIIDSSSYAENWIYDSVKGEWTYQAQITIDGNTVAYSWQGDTNVVGPTTAVENVTTEHHFNIFPNPTTNIVTLDLSSFDNDLVTIKAVNMLGQELYRHDLISAGSKQEAINTSGWADGMYLISVESAQHLTTEKLIKKQ